MGGMELRKQKQIRAVMVVGLCLLFLLAVANILHSSAGQNIEKREEAQTVSAVTGSERTPVLFSALKKKIYNTITPFFAFSEKQLLPDNAAEAVFLHACREFPFLYYAGEQGFDTESVESDSTYAMILALEGADEDNHTYFEEIDSRNAMELENQAVRADSENQITGNGDAGESVAADTEHQEGTDSGEAAVESRDSQAVSEGEGDQAASGNGLLMLRSTPSFVYDFSQYQDLESLVKGFYIVDPTTSVTEERLNLDTLLHTDVTIHGDNSSPQILIYHTHSQEGYVDSVPGDVSTGVVGAGEYLARLLREQYGYNVIHHTGQYDVEVRDQAYAVAEPEIEALLAQYPTIEVVIDLHRDEVREDVQLVTEVDGRPTAKFMFFNGLSYSNNLGDITYLANPHIQENLAFSFRAQVLVNEYYPGVSRGIYLRAYRYNMHFVGKNMLIELGAQTNTREEIWNTVPIIAQVLDMVFKGQ